MLGNFNSGGWQLEIGNNAGDRGLLGLYRSEAHCGATGTPGRHVTGA